MIKAPTVFYHTEPKMYITVVYSATASVWFIELLSFTPLQYTCKNTLSLIHTYVLSL